MHLDNECASGHRAPDVCDDLDLQKRSKLPSDVRQDTPSRTTWTSEKFPKRGSMAVQKSQDPQPPNASKAARKQSMPSMGYEVSVPFCEDLQQSGGTAREEVRPIAAAASQSESHEQAPDYVMTAMFTSSSGHHDGNQQLSCYTQPAMHLCLLPESEQSQQNHAHASGVPQVVLPSHQKAAFEDRSMTPQHLQPWLSPAANLGMRPTSPPEPQSLTAASCLPVTAPTDVHGCPGPSPELQEMHSAALPAAATGEGPSSIAPRARHPHIVHAAMHVSATGDAHRLCAIPDDPSVPHATPDAAPISTLPCAPGDERSQQPYSPGDPTECRPSEDPACTHATAEDHLDRLSSPASPQHEHRPLPHTSHLNRSSSRPAQTTVATQVDGAKTKLEGGQCSTHGGAVCASSAIQGCIHQGNDVVPAQGGPAGDLQTAPQPPHHSVDEPAPTRVAHAASGGRGSSSRPALLSGAEVRRAQAAGAASGTHQRTAGAAAAAAAAPAGGQSVPGTASKQRTLFGGVAAALPAAKRHSRVPAADKSVPGASSVPGQFVMAEFVSEEKEAQLLAAVDDTALPWKASRLNGPSRGKRWGVQTDLARRTVAPEAVPLPPALQAVAQRMRDTVPQLADFHPNEANAIEYQRDRGDYLLPHVDDRQLSTGFIVTLSLCGTACMTLSPEPAGRALRAHMQGARGAAPPALKAARPGAQFGNSDQQRDAGHCRVLLPPRALQVLSGPARYNFTHGIAADDILSPRRVSITFRQSPLRP